MQGRMPINYLSRDFPSPILFRLSFLFCSSEFLFLVFAHRFKSSNHLSLRKRYSTNGSEIQLDLSVEYNLWTNFFIRLH